MDIQGYCIIKPSAKSGISAAPIADFTGKPIRVMEFGVDCGVLVINSEATALAMFDKEDIFTSFKCDPNGLVLCPPGLTTIEKFSYTAKCLSRKGGYDRLVANVVIATSLAKGEFFDSFLFQ